MYFTDRGIEELEERRGEEQVSLAWVADRMRVFVDLNPEFEDATERLVLVTRLLTEELRAINVIPSLPATQVARTAWSPN